jgi:hypothetical protein
MKVQLCKNDIAYPLGFTYITGSTRIVPRQFVIGLIWYSIVFFENSPLSTAEQEGSPRLVH